VGVESAQAEEEGKDEGGRWQRALPQKTRLRQIYRFQSHYAFEHYTVTYLHRSSVNVRRTASYRSYLSRSALQLTQHSRHSRVLFRLRATTVLNPSKLVANFNIGGQVDGAVGTTDRNLTQGGRSWGTPSY